jgi:hypothetical protein
MNPCLPAWATDSHMIAGQDDEAARGRPPETPRNGVGGSVARAPIGRCRLSIFRLPRERVVGHWYVQAPTGDLGTVTPGTCRMSRRIVPRGARFRERDLGTISEWGVYSSPCIEGHFRRLDPLTITAVRHARAHEEWGASANLEPSSVNLPDLPNPPSSKRRAAAGSSVPPLQGT